MGVAFTATRLDSIVADLAERMDAIAWGHAAWEDLCRGLTDAFPDTCCFVFSENPVDEIVDGLSAINVAPAMLKAYDDYYAFRNPWISIWNRLPETAVAVSERDSPARLIERTEFYQDFILKVPNLDASTGLQVGCGPDSRARLLLHYSTRRAVDYDVPAEHVLQRLAAPLRRSIDNLAGMQARIDGQSAASALVARDDALAFVVDAGMRPQQINAAALEALERGHVLRARPDGRLSFTCDRLDERVAAAVAALAAHPAAEPVKLVFGEGADGWLIGFTRLPRVALNPILDQRCHILVQCRSLALPQGGRGPDKALLSGHYRLTPAELRLCERLMAGQTLAEASLSLGVGLETTRSRIKTIFQKTGTRRQAELVLLLQQTS